MKCRQVTGEKQWYWNIKGWGHFVARIRVKCLPFHQIGAGHLASHAAPLRYRSEKVVRRG